MSLSVAGWTLQQWLAHVTCSNSKGCCWFQVPIEARDGRQMSVTLQVLLLARTFYCSCPAPLRHVINEVAQAVHGLPSSTPLHDVLGI